MLFIEESLFLGPNRYPWLRPSVRTLRGAIFSLGAAGCSRFDRCCHPFGDLPLYIQDRQFLSGKIPDLLCRGSANLLHCPIAFISCALSMSITWSVQHPVGDRLFHPICLRRYFRVLRRSERMHSFPMVRPRRLSSARLISGKSEIPEEINCLYFCRGRDRQSLSTRKRTEP
jgi:hypothetical protein